MDPLGPSAGPFRHTAARALSSLRGDASVLSAALSVFATEPSMDWLDLADRSGIDKEEFKRGKLDTVRKKLAGEMPARTALKELQYDDTFFPVSFFEIKNRVFEFYRLNSRLNNKSLGLLQEVLLGPEGSLRRTLKGRILGRGEPLTAAEQVDCLIEAATDPGILRCGFSGWKPLV